MKTDKAKAGTSDRAKNSRGASECRSSRFKRGYNWRFIFTAVEMEDGGQVTIVKTQLLKVAKYNTDIVVSPYPGGRCEDSVLEAIDEAFRSLRVDADEDGILLHDVSSSCFKKLAIDAPADSGIVRGLAAALSRLRRVSVEFRKGALDD